VGAEVFARFAFGLHHGTDFLAGVFCVPFIYDIQKWGEVAVLLIVAVNSVIDSDETNTFLNKQDFGIKPYL